MRCAKGRKEDEERDWHTTPSAHLLGGRSRPQGRLPCRHRSRRRLPGLLLILRLLFLLRGEIILGTADDVIVVVPGAPFFSSCFGGSGAKSSSDPPITSSSSSPADVFPGAVLVSGEELKLGRASITSLAWSARAAGRARSAARKALRSAMCAICQVSKVCERRGRVCSRAAW